MQPCSGGARIGKFGRTGDQAMIIKGRITTTCAFAGVLLVGLAAGGAHAGINGAPRFETQCLNTKQVLKPSRGATLADIQPGGKVELVSVRICTAERRACFAYGDEVPMSLCEKG